MPQQPLTDQAIQTYILLEKTKRTLVHKIPRTQTHMIVTEQLGDPLMVEKIAQELIQLQTRLREVTSELSTYTISIDQDISDITQDRKQHYSSPLTLQQIKTEISRLEHRRSSLRIHASREESANENLLTRLQMMTQSIRSLEECIPSLVAEMKMASTLTRQPSALSMFKSEQPRDLRSSKDMRETLRHC